MANERIIFLDVDGVLNSYRNVIAQGGFPFPKGSEADKDPRHKEENLDQLAVGMIRKLCREFDFQIILHSTWRAHTDPIEFGLRWNLPIIGATDRNMHKPDSIKYWLNQHPEVQSYLVIDDDEMKVGSRQIKTDLFEGFAYKDYVKARKKLAYFKGTGPGVEK